MKFPIVPLGISVLLGAADGYVASYDVNHNTKAPGQPPALSDSKALWLQGGAVAAGVIGEFMNVHPDITESLMFGGATLASRAVTFKLAQSGRQGMTPGPSVAQGYSAALAAGPARNAAAFNVRQPAGSVA